jgi:hypothetical protein
MNSDSFFVLRSDYPTGHPFLTAPLSLASTTETAFLLANGQPATMGIIPQNAILGSSTGLNPNANAAISMDELGGSGYRGMRGRPYFSSGTFDGRAMRVRAQIKYTAIVGASAPALNFKLYVGTSATLASDTVLFTPGPRTLATAQTVNGNGILEATLLWDSVSQKLSGEAWAQISDTGNTTPTYTARAALTTVTVAAYTGLQFVVSTIYGTNAPTSSTQTLVELSVESV